MVNKKRKKKINLKCGGKGEKGKERGVRNYSSKIINVFMQKGVRQGPVTDSRRSGNYVMRNS